LAVAWAAGFENQLALERKPMEKHVSRRDAVRLAAVGGVAATSLIVGEANVEAADGPQVTDGPIRKQWTTRQIHTHLEAASRDAVLVSAVASFHTNDDDKDWDTKLSIYVRNRAGADVAKIENIMGRFPDNSNNGPFGLSVLVNIPKAQIAANSHTDLSIVTVGHDTWRFNYYLTLGFSDSTTLQYYWPGLVLDQDVRTLTRVL
jgi:hypothetical protein